MPGEISQIDEQTILAQYGPMRLTIQAWNNQGALDLALAAQAGYFSFTLLSRLVPARELFRREALDSNAVYEEPLLGVMVEAARMTGEQDLGPMAAVAGVVADAVALRLDDWGASKALVENGGDLAILLAPGRTASVGVRLGLDRRDSDYKVTLSGDRRHLWGVCSSGLGGRGLTQGIADTAMAIATSASVADAVATALGNACRVESPNIRRVPAEALRPDTDIRGLLVTERVGELTSSEIDTAVDNALCYAENLVAQGVILGGLVSLRGRMATTESFEELVAPLERL